MPLELRRYVGKLLGIDASRELYVAQPRFRGGGVVIVTPQPSGLGEILVSVKVKTGVSVAVGDIVRNEPDVGSLIKVSPASSQPWGGDHVTTNFGLAQDFVGIAKTAGSAGAFIDVDISPVTLYEFDCVSMTYEAGDFVGVAKAAGDALENKKLTRKDAGTGTDFAISSSMFRVVRQYDVPVTSIKVRMQSTFFGVNGAARVGDT